MASILPTTQSDVLNGPRGMAAFLKEENNLFRLRAEACDLRWLVFVVSGPVVAPIELVRTPTLRDLLMLREQV